MAPPQPRTIELASLAALFKRFEAACGKEHAPYRSFYGLRRILTDIAPDYTDDERIHRNAFPLVTKRAAT